MGYADLHLHLLPGVDDGARTIDESLQMARALVELGYTAAAPSPHNRTEYQPRAVADQQFDALRERLATEQIALVLHRNSENFFLDPELLLKANTPEGRRLGDTAVLLVEAPYTTVLPTLPDIVFRLKVKGITPLIAHPERCLETRKKGRAKEAVNAGAMLQLDIAALTGRYGPEAQKAARELLDAGLYTVAASDMHGPTEVKTWLSEAIAALRKGWGEPAVKALLDTGPNQLLAGLEPIPFSKR